MAERPAPSTKPVAQKLLLKPGSRALILNPPAGFLAQLPNDVQVEQQPGDGPYDYIHFFASSRGEVLAHGPRLRLALKPDGILWVSYPKGKVRPTDLNRDILRETLAEVGLEAVTQVAIDAVWSALRAKVL